MKQPKHIHGFSLIELLIALLISSLLLTGLVATFTNANTNYVELTKTGRQIENGRYAISVMDEDLRHAGFWGEYTGKLTIYDPSNPPVLNPPQPCADGPADFLGSVAAPNMMAPVYGYDGGAVAPLACIPNYQPNTDVVMIRRLSTTKWNPAMPLAQPLVYFQGYLSKPEGPTDPHMDYGTAGNASFNMTYPTGLAVPIRQFIQNIYYIASCHICTGGGDGVPTLTRLEYGGHNNFIPIPIAEGIEKMRVRYGVDNSVDGAGTPGIYKGAGAMVMNPDWWSVMTVEVNLLARNSETTLHFTDTRKYLLGDTLVPAANDGYRRHAFSQVIRLVNQSSKRQDQYRTRILVGPTNNQSNP